jgi:hypothetical protein
MVAPGVAGARSRLPGTPVPRGFVGVNIDGPMITAQNGVALPDQFGVMGSSGVQSVRAVFSWSTAQPYATSADVPAGQQGAFVTGAGGVPTNFAGTDQIVGLAAAQGMTVLPIVIGTPSWDLGAVRYGFSLYRPRDNGPYGQYLTTLIGRYGPRGSFWSQNPNLPRRPIRMWQVWNEANLGFFWPTQPFASSYVALLRVAHAAIKQADPGARVVLAGLTKFSWRALATIYRVRGARKLFDVVEAHPYTKYPTGVIQILGYVRSTMDGAGDRGKPIIAGETGWLSSLHQTPHFLDYETTEAVQAQRLRSLLPLFAANRARLRLSGFYWYTWMGDEYPGAYDFNFSGLLAFHNGQVRAKPALAAFGQAAQQIER